MSLCLPFTFCLCFSHVCLYITWSVKSTNTKKYENVIKITPLLYCHATSQSPSLTTSLLHFLLLMLVTICNDCVEELHSNRKKIYWSHHIHHAFFHVHSVTIHYVYMPASQKKSSLSSLSLSWFWLAKSIPSATAKGIFLFSLSFFRLSCC